MSKDIVHEPKLAEAGRRKVIKGQDLDTPTLIANNEITIWSAQVNSDTVLYHGYGSRNREVGENAFTYFEALADGTGNGADGDAIEGTLIAVITDSEQQDVLARREIGDLQDLADAQSDARTERPHLPAQGPAAGEDKHLELRIEADSASDGVVLANDSNVRYYYGRVSV